MGSTFSNLFIFILLIIKFSNILKVSFDFKILKKSLNISLPLTPKIFFGILNSQFDKYMIGLLNNVGGVEFILYHKNTNVSFLFMNAIQHVYAPKSLYKNV